MLSQKFLEGGVEKSDIVGRLQQSRCAFGETESVNALPLPCRKTRVGLGKITISFLSCTSNKLFNKVLK